MAMVPGLFLHVINRRSSARLTVDMVLYSSDGLQSGRARTSSCSMPLELGEIDLESAQVAVF